jgi:hypothetical protein
LAIKIENLTKFLIGALFMITLWDVLDTTVKIGLGAVIASVSSHYQLKLANKFTESSKRESDKYSLLQNVVSGIRRITEKINDFSQASSRMDPSEDWVDLERELVSALKEKNRAEISAILLGSREFTITLANLGGKIVELHAYVQKTVKIEHISVNEKLEEIGLLLTELDDQLLGYCQDFWSIR